MLHRQSVLWSIQFYFQKLAGGVPTISLEIVPVRYLLEIYTSIIVMGKIDKY